MAYKELAIIGSTASGKSSLAIKVAKKFKGIILSLDSLSIYKEIDIVSAKPSKSERKEIKHYGVDILYPNEYFSVSKFVDLYKDVSLIAKNSGVPLIITGGSSFYLKMLIDGISPLPSLSFKKKLLVESLLKDRAKALSLILKVDPNYKVEIKDTYRLQKALEIYFATSLTPSEYFKKNPPIPIISNINIFEIVWDRECLRDRIKERTFNMLQDGLIDEVAYLEAKYRDRTLTPLKAIGIKEVFGYFDGLYKKEEMIQKIIINTSRLAKRQTTFNRSQFSQNSIVRGDLEFIQSNIENYLLEF